jgi:RND superfamily putative drug exporter
VAQRTRTFVTGRIGAFCARRRAWVIPLGALVVVLALVVLNSVSADTEPQQGGTGESVEAADLIDERFADVASSSPPAEFVVFSHPTLTVDDPEYRGTVEGTVETLRALRFDQRTADDLITSTRIVGDSTTHYDIGAPRQLSPIVAPQPSGGDVTYAVVELEGSIDASEASSVPVVVDQIDVLTDAVSAANAEAPEFEIVVGGDASASKQADDNIQEDFARASLINLPLTFVILIITFGTVLAALIPVALAFAGVLTALGIMAIVSQAYPLEPVYTQVVLLIGLAAGIDYALFMVSRYRRQRRDGEARQEAIASAWSNTGRNVLIAGSTTVLSITGMFLVGDPVFTALGLAAMVAVIVAVVLAMTVLPALTGDWLNRLRVPGMPRATSRRPSLANRLAAPIIAAACRRPGAALGLGVLVLLALASPVVLLNTGFNGARAFNDDIEAKVAFVAIEENFTLGLTAPAQVVVDAGEGENVFDAQIQAGVVALTEAVEAETAAAQSQGREPLFGPGVESETNDAGDTQVVEIPINADVGEDRAFDAVDRLRGDLIPAAFADAPADVLVTGASAGSLDFTDNINARTPIVYAFVILTAFLLLLVMYRAPVVAAIAVVLNLLAVAAAYGLLVLIFQEGVALEGLFGFDATGIIESWLPLFVFTIMFGISMDYLTFAIGRVKELHDAGTPAARAVQRAVSDSFGVVFGAAMVMVAVALVFAFTRDIGLQQFGFTLAVAVFLDATLILAVVLPAALRLPGEGLFWLPNWLQWLPGSARRSPPSPEDVARTDS